MLERRNAVGFVDRPALDEIAATCRLSRAEAYELASFYPAVNFSAAPNPAPFLEICNDLPCKLRRSTKLEIALKTGELDGIPCKAGACQGRCAAGNVVAQRNVPAAPPTHVLVERAVSLETYLLSGGYRGLGMNNADELSIDAVLRQAAEATGAAATRWGTLLAKWPKVLHQSRRPVLICNADESDPGSFKDLYLLEADPHGVLEGAIVAARLIDADRLILFVRHDYASACARLEGAIEEASKLIPVDLKVELISSGGAYICGEETALIASLEGLRGVPREAPYSSIEHGVCGQPAVVHNVETLYRLRSLWGMTPHPSIEASRLLDPEFDAVSLSGRVAEPGIKLLPFRCSIRELVEASGGMESGYKLGGALVGGALGALVSGELLEVPRAELAKRSPFWTPSIIAFSTNEDFLAMALDVVRFHARESCGHCTPCRVGTARAVELLEARVRDCSTLSDLAFVMREASACGLGKGAGKLLEGVVASISGARP